MKRPRRRFLQLAAGAAALPAVPPNAQAQTTNAGAREAPARVLPVPDTVSPQMQGLIGRPLNPRYNIAPETTAEWKARVDEAARAVVAGLPRLREALGVSVEPTSISGVNAFVVTPRSIPEANRGHILLHLHGGVRVLNPGEAGTREAIMMAGFAALNVISVDYRMPPDHPFPAAVCTENLIRRTESQVRQYW
jgi:acetyl esterase/lipase